MTRYEARASEAHWQRVWHASHIYEPNLRDAARPFYNLLMFPYPSAEGLHVGNVYAFTGADIYARFMAMQGHDVFEPIGFDAFGIHSENFAIQRGEHPAALTTRNVERFRKQLQQMGFRFDWRHEVQTTDPDYYRWTQWIFVQLFKAGLAVRKKAPVNWCPTDRTVLADEQVIEGRCERCDTPVVQRELEQWFLRITAYADRLLDNLDHLDWSEVVKTAQRRWIGRTTEGTFRLRDWLISRQRYWGSPIPIVYCPKCGTVPVPEEQLPVRLPDMEDWTPRPTGSSPLADVASFVETTCPECGAAARRETDVADNFLESAWYYLRYPSALSNEMAFDRGLTEKWLPVNMYIGGAEHSVLHLLYSRFMCMALHDLGFVDFEEPFVRFRAHGLLTLHGAKMSKSRGNVVNPDQYIERYGADVLRLYLMFLGPFDQGGGFSDRGIGGIARFVQRLWRLVTATERFADDRAELHRLIHRVSDDLAGLRYNTAVAALMGYASSRSAISDEAAKVLPRLMAPLAPHLAEELWARLGQPYSVHQQPFPVADPSLLVTERQRVAVQVNGRTRGAIELPPGASEAEAIAEARATMSIVFDTQRVIYVAGRVLNFVTR
jgi:leucyl-tRNA synthetase